jgi:hypothetical protein
MRDHGAQDLVYVILAQRRAINLHIPPVGHENGRFDSVLPFRGIPLQHGEIRTLWLNLVLAQEIQTTASDFPQE